MATNPAQAPADPEDLQDGGADEASEDQGQDAGYEVVICVKPDGSFRVGVEPASEESGEYEDESKYKPASNVKEALTIALEAIKADGQMPDDGSADADLDAGFKSRGGY
jgi:hypothetical protein